MLKEKGDMILKYEEKVNQLELSNREKIDAINRENSKMIENLQRQQRGILEGMTKNEDVERMKLQYQHEIERATVTLTQQL